MTVLEKIFDLLMEKSEKCKILTAREEEILDDIEHVIGALRND